MHESTQQKSLCKVVWKHLILILQQKSLLTKAHLLCSLCYCNQPSATKSFCAAAPIGCTFCPSASFSSHTFFFYYSIESWHYSCLCPDINFMPLFSLKCLQQWKATLLFCFCLSFLFLTNSQNRIWVGNLFSTSQVKMFCLCTSHNCIVSSRISSEATFWSLKQVATSSIKDAAAVQGYRPVWRYVKALLAEDNLLLWPPALAAN